MIPRPGFPKMRRVYRGANVGIECLGCGSTSWHPVDVEEVYCAHCHLFGQLEEGRK